MDAKHYEPERLKTAGDGAAVAISEASVWTVSADMRDGLSRWVVAATALFHLLPIILWLWYLHAIVRPATPVFAVTLVREPPKPPAKPTPAEAAKIAPRESGAEEKTEAKKTDEPPKPALPRAASMAERSAKPAPSAEPPPVAIPAPKVLSLKLPDRGGNAARDVSGDPYLNHLLTAIEGNRVYPPAAEFGEAAQKLVVYSVVVEPTGQISTMTLIVPSGHPRIDEAARQMITATAPFPHLPADYPQFRTSITIGIPIYPRG